MKQYTPMIKQYLSIKADFEDAFLFFRLGDFYELFFEDAVKAAQELEITLTSRDGGGSDRIPMCGVPHHSAQSYIESLINKGYKVAICEQVEDPREAKGVVKREVVQLITPGTVMDSKRLADKENNFLASITQIGTDEFGFAYVDLSTGESFVTKVSEDFTMILNELATVDAKEIVIATDFKEDLLSKISERFLVTVSYEDDLSFNKAGGELLADLHDQDLKVTVSRLINYLHKTQKRNLSHLQRVKSYEINEHMTIDFFSKRNLELTETIRTKGRKGSLIWLLDETKTAMGGRLLKAWLDRPLITRSAIETRHQLVDTFKSSFFEREELRELLTEVYDLERLAGRISFGNVNARDLIQLNHSLSHLPNIKKLVRELPNEKAKELADQLDPCKEVTELLSKAMAENPPISIKEGNIIKDNYNEKLDKYRDASKNGKVWLAELEKSEREKTGIKSLKVGYNRIFGYFIEVTRANLHLLEEDRYERKQTLTNAERFITPELKEKEALILDAEEKSIELEYKLFVEIREFVKDYIPEIQKLAKLISELDVLQCFATTSENYHFVRPEFSEDESVEISEGRHPVVEKVMGIQEYVPNDCYMDSEREILIVTGPNMSGKSTYMRQVALIAILAQIGCFVPASSARLPIFDQIFTRIGAADDLIAGQSTFMVEMLEANYAIENATKSSLILLDEIGRGTSTYDGIALAQAMIEHIHNKIGAKTLFSTHYHELTSLDKKLSKVQNIHVSAIEQSGNLVFLHKISEGPTDRSYGIHVAKLANMPDELIARANNILQTLETVKETGPEKGQDRNSAQLSFFPEESLVKETSNNEEKDRVLYELEKIDLIDITPREALNKLFDLQKLIKDQ